MSTPWMIYGANGYTGALIAEKAAAEGLRPVLAGRNGPAVAQLAGRLGLEHRVFDLADADAVAVDELAAGDRDPDARARRLRL